MKTILQILNNWLSGFLPSWLPFDKLIHFTVCAIGAFIEGWVPKFTIGLAIGKETGDYFNEKSGWCWKDLLYDLAGLLTGLMLRYMVKQF